MIVRSYYFRILFASIADKMVNTMPIVTLYRSDTSFSPDNNGDKTPITRPAKVILAKS